MSLPLVRAEELVEWISQVTDQNIRNEHLSISLQNGQVLCHLANALDSEANLKINRLTTIFHTKSNINAFLRWCQTQGLTDGEIFQMDDLLGPRDFEAVIATLSILYDQHGGARYSLAQNPAAVEQSYASSTEEHDTNDSLIADDLDDMTKSQYISKAGSKLTSFVKGNLLSVRKKGKFFKKSKDVQPQGTPVGTTPPSTPSMNDSDKPTSPPIATPKSKGSKKVSTLSSSRTKALEKISTPPIYSSNAKETNKLSTSPTARPVRANSKLEAFITKLPAPIVAPPASKEHVQRKNLSNFMDTDFSGSVENPLPTSKPIAMTSIRSNNSSKKLNEFLENTVTTTMKYKENPITSPEPANFSMRRAAFENKKTLSKSSVSSKSTKPVLHKNHSTNRLQEFTAKQSMNAVGNITLSKPKENKLAAFLAVTESPARKLSIISNGSTHSIPFARDVPSNDQRIAVRHTNSALAKKQAFKRSTGSGNYVRKRQTYWINRPPARFSLEEKRALFMEEQLQLKEKQTIRAAGEISKQSTIVPGLMCYVPDIDEVWVHAEVLSFNEKRNKVQVEARLQDGDVHHRELNLNDPDIIRAIAGPSASSVESLPISIIQDSPEGVDDMRFLRFLNEPSILFNLKQRFAASRPYTYSTDIVIAINPYKWIDNLYGDHLHEKYMNYPRESLSPHVYATSTAAFKHMTEHQMNQSILVSGESGAGKTETTKIVMNHLASIAGGRKDKTIAKVIDVNPLLESFGNAKTTRNDNSSRFGKFTQLQFDIKGKLIGAKCETYLLEKSRVVSITENERNYHIFYQMLAGLKREELDAYGLDSLHEYAYIGGALEDMQIPGTDDKKLFRQTCNSLSLIGLSEQDQSTLFQILAGVLHLGEICFAEFEENGSIIANTDHLNQVSRALGFENEQVEHVLCNRSVTARNERVTVPLDPIEAEQNRDALVKSIYSNLFDWMVVRINDAISSDEDRIHAQIGVLDIFGFEDFAHNGFEQFCINYANEKLQQKFTIDVFKTVEDEYRREGLNWDHIQYQDNQEILEVIEGKMGIIAQMNDHLRQPRGTEEALVNKIKSTFTKSGKNCHIEFPKMKRTQFTIHHYAGPVTYESVGFMEKHRDALHGDLLDLVLGSELELLPEIFEPLERRESSESTGSSRTKKSSSARSLGTQFKISLSRLMENISTTNAHYIRCIKPNANKSPHEFDKRMVVEQLRSAGVIEAIRITRSGYPSRLTPKELAKRYCIMFPPSFQSKDERKTCVDFMNAIGRKAPLDYQIGATLVYLKNGVMEELEAMKSDFYYYEATFIQKIVLGFLERQRLRRKIQASIRIQAFIRMALDKIQYRKSRRSIRIIQRHWRRYQTAQLESHESEESDVSSIASSDRKSLMEEDFEYPVTEGSDASFESSHGPATPPRNGKTFMSRFRMTRSKSNSIEESSEEARNRRKNSLKRMEELSESAQRILEAADQESTNKDMSLEEENAVLRAENRNLKYDLELMREQCMELQSIIVEINRSRKKGKPI